jgi:hypothetical protein
MGKKDKEHRAKVAKRNKKIQQAQKVYQRMYSEMMMKEIERIKTSQSGDTPTEITI